MMTAVVARLSSTVPSRNTSGRGGRKIYYMNKEYKLFIVKRKKQKEKKIKSNISPFKRVKEIFDTGCVSQSIDDRSRLGHRLPANGTHQQLGVCVEGINRYPFPVNIAS